MLTTAANAIIRRQVSVPPSALRGAITIARAPSFDPLILLVHTISDTYSA
jgi:hypothetical protein